MTKSHRSAKECLAQLFEREAHTRSFSRLRKEGDTLSADKGYDVEAFAEELKSRGISPHVARNTSNGRRNVIDGRAARSKGYAISLQVCKRIGQGFGRVKSIGDLRKLPLIGLEKVNAWAHWNFAAYNLIRIPHRRGAWWNPSPT